MRLENACGTVINMVIRGFLARSLCKRIRYEKAQKKRTLKATIDLQRLFRGFKGRERSEVQKKLREMQHKARPLVKALDELTNESKTCLKKLEADRNLYDALTLDTRQLEQESLLCSIAKSAYTDSSRINQTPQRFITQFLRIKLKELLTSQTIKLAELHDKTIERETQSRIIDIKIRKVQRELNAITTGLVEKTKRERTKRLRLLVRKKEASAINIQKLFRGYNVRKSILLRNNPARDSWTSQFDDVIGKTFYYNIKTGRTSWSVPVELLLMPRLMIGSDSVQVFKGYEFVST